MTSGVERLPSGELLRTADQRVSRGGVSESVGRAPECTALTWSVTEASGASARAVAIDSTSAGIPATTVIATRIDRRPFPVSLPPLVSAAIDGRARLLHCNRPITRAGSSPHQIPGASAINRAAGRLLIVGAVGLMAIGASLAGIGPVAGAAAGIDWPKFRFDLANTGYNPSETTISRSNVSGLALTWHDAGVHFSEDAP